MANLARGPEGKRNRDVCRYAQTSIYDLDSFLRGNFHYRDEYNEIVRSPEWSIRDLESIGYFEGDCDDIATLAVALLGCSRIPARLTAMESVESFRKGTGFDHVFAEGWEGDWVPIDPTVPYGTPYQYMKMIHESL